MKKCYYRNFLFCIYFFKKKKKKGDKINQFAPRNTNTIEIVESPHNSVDLDLASLDLGMEMFSVAQNETKVREIRHKKSESAIDRGRQASNHIRSKSLGSKMTRRHEQPECISDHVLENQSAAILR